MINKQEYTWVVNFMETVPGVLIVGWGHSIHYNDYGLSSTLAIYRTLVAVVLR